MTENTNALAVRASVFPEAREQLIAQNEQTILRTASRLCRKYITKSDDEWSVSLCAFSHAIDVYSDTRGDFLPFAQMLIKRNLTDYYRSQEGQRREICVAPQTFEGGTQSPEEYGQQSKEAAGIAAAQQCCQPADDALRTEVEAANLMLREFGFCFFDLVSCSPKQDRSRTDCAKAVRAALRSPQILRKLRKSGKLPVRDLCRESGLSRKTIDRYRKYIIMAILILEDDYPCLSEYLRFIRESQ